MKMRLAALTLIAAALASSPGATQIAPGSNAPVDMSADHSSAVQSSCMAKLSGNVELKQERSRLRANTIEVYRKKNGKSCGGDLDRMEAAGDIFYVTPEQRIRGDRATYQASSSIMTVTGDVILDQGGNIIRGRRLVINVDTGTANMDGDGGRVRGIFMPNQGSATKRP